MENVPKFIKEFSKENNKEKRNEIAHNIKEYRIKISEDKKAAEIGVEEKLKEKESKQTLLEEKKKELENLRLKIEEINNNFLIKWFLYFKEKSLKKEEEKTETQSNNLEYQIDDIKREIISLNRYASLSISSNQRDIKYCLENFYSQEEKNWSSSKFSKEEIKKYFNEEYLSPLSLKEYEILLRKFPGNMLTHVTRQGVRDHIGMWYHSAGEGEFHNGFKDILNDNKRLISPLGVKIKEEQKSKELTNYLINVLDLEKAKSKEEILKKLNDDFNLNPDSYDSEIRREYLDRSAIHFAAEEVADYYYGAEKENEIFYVFSGNLIASQYYFRDETYLVKDNHDTKWNDRWIWIKENDGISLDAGLVFIPKDTLVDKETGSKYKTDKEGEPIVNQQDIDILDSFVKNDDFDHFAERVLFLNTGRHKYKEDDYKERIHYLKNELQNKFRILNQELQDIILNGYNFLYKQKVYKEDRNKEESAEYGHEISDITKECLKEKSLYFLKADNSITSQEYWEDYFTKHQDQKPTKIIFYEEKDPTEAVNKWKERAGIYKNESDGYWHNNAYQKEEEGILGFSENLLKNREKETQENISRFKNLAIPIIEDYFNNKK